MIAALLAGVLIGTWGDWGAFTQGARCYAIAAPATRRSVGASTAIATRAGGGGRRALFVRLSAPAADVAPVTLVIGARRFVLTARGRAAFAPDAASDAAIVAAMRGARSMSVSGVATSGRPFADSYALSGAATAIDAATLACA